MKRSIREQETAYNVAKNERQKKHQTERECAAQTFLPMYMKNVKSLNMHYAYNVPNNAFDRMS